MSVTLDDRAHRLLDLMREADEEAVTLDELRIAGIPDPALALHALELAGIGVERVVDRTQRGLAVSCVRLARPAAEREPTPPPAPEPEPPRAALPDPAWPPPAPAPRRAGTVSPAHLLAALLGLLLLGALLRAVARR